MHRVSLTLVLVIELLERKGRGIREMTMYHIPELGPKIYDISIVSIKYTAIFLYTVQTGFMPEST
jgi:hypothetical protein